MSKVPEWFKTTIAVIVVLGVTYPFMLVQANRADKYKQPVNFETDCVPQQADEVVMITVENNLINCQKFEAPLPLECPIKDKC